MAPFWKQAGESLLKVNDLMRQFSESVHPVPTLRKLPDRNHQTRSTGPIDIHRSSYENIMKYIIYTCIYIYICVNHICADFETLRDVRSVHSDTRCFTHSFTKLQRLILHSFKSQDRLELELGCVGKL